MFFGYINLSFSPFFRLSNVYRRFKRSSVAVKRFVRLKNIAPESMKHGEKVLENPKGEIEIRNLSFGYTKDKDTLKNLNLGWRDCCPGWGKWCWKDNIIRVNYRILSTERR